MLGPVVAPAISQDKKYKRGLRQFTIPKEFLTYYDFSATSSFKVMHVKAFSVQNCHDLHPIVLEGNYFSGRTVLCVKNQDFKEDLTFYSADGPNDMLWVETMTRRMIMPLYYRVLNEHLAETPSFTRMGGRVCFANRLRDRILDSIRSWNNCLGASDPITISDSKCSPEHYVVLNSTHESPLCSITQTHPQHLKPLTFRKYCANLEDADWSLTGISFDVSSYLHTFSDHLKKQWKEFVSHVEKELESLAEWVLKAVIRTLEYLLDKFWASVNGFNEKYYFFEYLIFFIVLSYRSGSSVAAVSACVVVVWSFGFTRTPEDVSPFTE